MSDLRALSIRQPWVAAILYGPKRVENRTWKTNYRGPLVIHASTRRDQVWFSVPPLSLCDLPAPDRWVQGAHCGVVELVGIHHHRDGRCGENCRVWGEPGVYHWEFAQVRRFETPVPARGYPGLFRAPALVNS